MTIAEELTRRIKVAAPEEADDFGILTSRLEIPDSDPMTVYELTRRIWTKKT